MQRPPHIEQQIERFVDRFFEGLVAQAENKDEASAYRRMAGSTKVRREYREAFGSIIDVAAQRHGRWPNPSMGKALPATAQALAHALMKKYGVDVKLGEPAHGDDEWPPICDIYAIFVPKGEQGQGLGQSAMEDIVGWADRRGYALALTPSDNFGASVRRLKSWYRRLGFVPNRGACKDFRTTEAMIRMPHGRWPNPYGILASSEAFPGDIGQRVFYERPQQSADERAMREWQEYARARQLNPIPKKRRLAPRSSQPYPSVEQSGHRRKWMHTTEEERREAFQTALEARRKGMGAQHDAFLRRLPQMIVDGHLGEYVLFAEGKEQGYFKTKREAIKAGYQLYALDKPWLANAVAEPGSGLEARMRSESIEVINL